MIEAAQNGGVILMISHNQRFMGPHRIAKDILDSGRLGMVYLIHGVFGHQGPEIWSPTQEWYFQPEQAGLGVCADLGYHKIDLIRWITNQEITSISAFKNTFEKQTALEDTAVFCFQLSRGSLGTIQVSWVFRPDWENSLTIRCEKGVIRIPTEANEPVKVLTNQGTSTLVEANYQCSSPDTSGWFGAVGAFLEAVKNGLPSPVPGDDARASLAVVLAANLSANQKKVIDLQGKP
jgi:predicted dehydrogenase